jgi:hypothetical protein
MTSPLPLVIRTQWPDDFPDVIVHSEVSFRDAQASYAPAKSGDPVSALQLAHNLVSQNAVEKLAATLNGRHAIMLPVIAEETAGFNAIPDATAHVLGFMLNLPVAVGEVVQTNVVGHTRAPAFQRIVAPATFQGTVHSGCDYVLIDDHIGLGGTLANLRGHIEFGGGRVVAMSTLTQSRDAHRISLHAKTRLMLWEKHGQELDNLWNGQFGYGIDCLTEIEAQNLCRQPSVVAIENYLAKAAIEMRGRGLDPSANASAQS